MCMCVEYVNSNTKYSNGITQGFKIEEISSDQSY